MRHFITSYARLFADGKDFPVAKDLLTATAEANNRSAKDIALAQFKSAVDAIIGADQAYMHESRLTNTLEALQRSAMEKFHKVCVCVCVCV